MEYQAAVAEARTLVKRSEEDQWRLAQLSYEQVRLGGKSGAQWARDVGMSDRYATSLVRLWDRWESAAPADRPSFNDAMAAIHTPGRFQEKEETGSQAAAEAVRTIRQMPPERRAEVVREALDDQDVAVRVLRDPHTRRNVTDAREQVAQEIETAARDRVDADPQSRAIREASLTINIESNISKARFWLAESARQVQDLEDRDPAVMERLARDVDEVDLAVGWLRTAIEGGRVSDEDLARLLEGGA